MISANKGHAKSMYNLALSYDILENYPEARKWYQKAYENGIEKAKEDLKELEGK